MDARQTKIAIQNEAWIDRPLPRRLIPLMISLTILCVLATHGIIRYGSFSAALSRVNGQRILVDPPLQAFGDVVEGRTVSANFILRNEAFQRITIQGAKVSCGCAVVSDLPCVIEPGGSRSIGLSVVPPKDNDQFAGTVSLYTDDRGTPVIALGYQGRVVKSVVAGPSRDGPN